MHWKKGENKLFFINNTEPLIVLYDFVIPSFK